MTYRIVELMRSQTRGVAWLQSALQSAIELELSTLPPYLCAYWCVKDKNSYPAKQIKSIFYQEMLHFGIACNLLSATGKQPEVLKGFGRIKYPGPLPGGVIPACDGKLVPCDPDFKVELGFTNFHGFAWMATQIEYPEDPVPRPHLLAEAETFPTIGQFYYAIVEALQENNAKIPYIQTYQQSGELGLTPVTDIDSASSSIKLIQQQGEGGSKYPFSAPGVLSHFYAFGELYFLQKYQFDAASQTGDWSGEKIILNDDDVYQMTPVPEGGYASPTDDTVDFDRAFTQMLQNLESAWSGGGNDVLSTAIGFMQDLTTIATRLLGKQIPRKNSPGIYGPQFKINMQAPGSGS
ncbi:MAG: ferritin-like protein [Acidobacteriaceae bacterium]